MSDTFDHEVDAWQDCDRDYDGGASGASGDPNYYHSWVQIEETSRESEKAIMVKRGPLAFWVPKSLIRDRKRGRIFVHLGIFNDLHWAAIREKKRELDDLPNLDDEK